MEIRKARKSDYAAICALMNYELGYPSVKLSDIINTMKEMNKDPNYSTYVAVVDDKTVGFIGFIQNLAFENGGKYIRINYLAVNKDYQGQGIGSSLLNYVESYADLKEICVSIIYSGFERTDAHYFYENNGYTKSSYGFFKYKLINFI